MNGYFCDVQNCIQIEGNIGREIVSNVKENHIKKVMITHKGTRMVHISVKDSDYERRWYYPRKIVVM